jgi:hypothetical protein
VIHDSPITGFEFSASRASLNDLSCRLMTGNDTLVAFRPLTEVFVVNASNVGAANGRRFDAKKNLAMSRRRDGNLSQFHRAVSG